MEIYKPLKDWELSCLAERMSPMEFDQIAIRYMEIRKVCVFSLFHKYKITYIFQSKGILLGYTRKYAYNQIHVKPAL